MKLELCKFPLFKHLKYQTIYKEFTNVQLLRSDCYEDVSLQHLLTILACFVFRGRTLLSSDMKH